MSISVKGIEAALTQLGIFPEQAASAAIDERITWTEAGLRACMAFTTTSKAAAPGAVLWTQYLRHGKLPPAARHEIAVEVLACPWCREPVDLCHGIHGWPAIHQITGTPCIGDPGDRYHQRCYERLEEQLRREQAATVGEAIDAAA